MVEQEEAKTYPSRKFNSKVLDVDVQEHCRKSEEGKPDYDRCIVFQTRNVEFDPTQQNTTTFQDNSRKNGKILTLAGIAVLVAAAVVSVFFIGGKSADERAEIAGQLSPDPILGQLRVACQNGNYDWIIENYLPSERDAVTKRVYASNPGSSIRERFMNNKTVRVVANGQIVNRSATPNGLKVTFQNKDEKADIQIIQDGTQFFISALE